MLVGRRRVGLRLLLEDRHRRRAGDDRGGRVVPAERARLPQRRRRLRGRHGQPRPAPPASRWPARCWSTTCSRWRCRSRRAPSTPPRRSRPDPGPRGDGRRRSWCWLLMAMNLRGVRESGTFFAIPTYAFMVGDPRHVRLRPAAPGRRAPCPRSRAPTSTSSPRPGYEAAADHGRADVPAGPRLLVRLCGADRRRGDLQRRAGLPQAQEPQRRHHAAAARHDRDHDDDERHRAGQPDGAAATSTRTSSSGSTHRRRAACPRATTSTR